MKIKKGLKLLSIFLAICAITLYLPNNITIVSAEQSQEPEYVEEETLCIDTEESETETDIGIIGGMTEIPSVGENTSDILSNDFVHIKLLDGGSGGAYRIQDGIYAFENLGNDGLWMDIQQDKYLPGYHMQQYAADGNPAQTFDRSCLFKITRRESTDSYIIRSMLNNRLTFYFSGNEVLTKEIPPNDADVSVNDTFKLEYNPIRECFVIKPYSSSNAVAANNTTASGMAGAPNSYLIKSTESTSGNQARWYMYQYTGETHSGVIPVFSPTTTSGALIQNKTYNIKIVTWTTEIGKNTPYALVHPDSQGMATGTWDASTCTLTLTTEKAGPFKLRSIIRSDGTTTAFRTYYGNYPIIPDIIGDTGFLENVATGKYVDIEGPSTAEGAFIQQWQFNGKLQSKWLFEVQSGGYFTIKSPYSHLYVGVDPTNTEYIRQYDSIENNTLWKFVETSSGNYKLVCKSLEVSGYVLATQSQTSGNGSNLMMTPYNDDTNYSDEWSTHISRGAALLAVEESYDRSSYFDTIQSKLESIGYTDCFNNHSTLSNGVMRADFLEYMRYSKITLIRTHGSKTVVQASDGYLSVSDLNALPSNYLMYSDLIIYGACSTAEGGKYDTTNLVNATLAGGAKTVIGFETSVGYLSCNYWCQYFFEYYAQNYDVEGKTFQDACNDAYDRVLDNPKCTSASSVEDSVIVGNEYFQ
ncbi:MAG: RICIN domain-containing protein [Clostridia bacterium]|nr:RICIN domain-containing protein [Clostridia bacterium]